MRVDTNGESRLPWWRSSLIVHLIFILSVFFVSTSFAFAPLPPSRHWHNGRWRVSSHSFFGTNFYWCSHRKSKRKDNIDQLLYIGSLLQRRKVWFSLLHFAASSFVFFSRWLFSSFVGRQFFLMICHQSSITIITLVFFFFFFSPWKKFWRGFHSVCDGVDVSDCLVVGADGPGGFDFRSRQQLPGLCGHQRNIDSSFLFFFSFSFLSFSGGKSRKCFSFFLVRKIEVMTFGLNSSHAAAKHVKWITHWFFFRPGLYHHPKSREREGGSTFGWPTCHLLRRR